ncbi:MAG: hypothetical protein JSV10_09190 [Candidatus Zixiibacteriota bacterium]|nr:MAG: hypothetical protein JSV10_09190 [candidate division Zixibacteria bacterium]
MKPIKVNPLAKTILSRAKRLILKPEAFSFTRETSETQNVLICMPADIDRFAMARDLLSTFVSIFRAKKVFVLLPFLEAEGYLSRSATYEVICAKRGDVNTLSLPGRQFVRRLKELRFGISLDLDLEDGFFSCYLCARCGVPMRIGPKRKNAFPLYNIELEVLKDRFGSREIYEGLARTLKSLFTESRKRVPKPA